jgi:hypothetical protein
MGDSGLESGMYSQSEAQQNRDLNLIMEESGSSNYTNATIDEADELYTRGRGLNLAFQKNKEYMDQLERKFDSEKLRRQGEARGTAGDVSISDEVLFRFCCGRR